MSHICKKEQHRAQLEADLARHKRARQMAVFEITKIKTAIRRMRPNIAPHMQWERWLHKVNHSSNSMTVSVKINFQKPITAWYNEKHHSCKISLIEFEIQQLKVEIELESGPLPWDEFQEKNSLLTELKDNILRFKAENELFLKEEHSISCYTFEQH